MLAREGTTPARLKKLKDAIPTSRKITKTDLAKYLNAWDQKPDLVSLGAQKNFERFMEAVEDTDSTATSPDIQFYKQTIAKVILFKTAHKIVRPMFPAFQANVAAYLVAVSAKLIGRRLDLERIWQHQDLSQQLKQQLSIWASEVNEILHRSANGRMISEWAKKPECWVTVSESTYSNVSSAIPEIKQET